MAARQTIAEEAIAAIRGVFALVFGDRRAADYFDFSERGLYGSFIAFLGTVLIAAALPALLRPPDTPGSVFQSVLTMALMFAFEIGAGAIVLRQLNRLDGFVPYLIATNWATSIGLLAQVIGLFAGLPPEVVVIVVGLASLLVSINIGRLILTLRPLHIVIFLVVQLVGGSIALLLVAMMYPISPAELEALGVSTQPA